MTKQQRTRLGNISQRGVSLLVELRRYEHEHHGNGPTPAVLLDGHPASWWITCERLTRTGLIVIQRDGTVRTGGVARTIGSSWWGRSVAARS